MNEKQFLKTMIETIKYDEDIQNKDDLLGILRYSIVTLEKPVHIPMYRIRGRNIWI